MVIIDFIKTYWREILEVLAVLISIVICCIKKKPVKMVDCCKTYIVQCLPALIVLAEKNSMKGQEKLNYVIERMRSLLIAQGYIDDTIDQYVDFIKEQVEIILCTPQKKGVK